MLMSDDEQEIRSLINTWMAATAAGDLPTVLSLMSDDVIFMVTGKKPFGKAEFAGSFRAMNDVQIDGHGEIQELNIDGTWAWCRMERTVLIRPAGGTPVRRTGPALTILRRQPDGRWAIARDANLLG
jgi:uncharacterized protein (TIGR02246 family)